MNRSSNLNIGKANRNSSQKKDSESGFVQKSNRRSISPGVLKQEKG